MDSTAFGALLATAGAVGLVHTLAGPDHYVPFIAMARARDWSPSRTATITVLCGIGHVGGSVVLGAVGIGLGLALGWMESVESIRGDLAGWLLLGFGLAYAAWGFWRALRNRPHSHWHSHGDGTVHDHEHGHHGAHAHAHDAHDAHGVEGAESAGKARSITPWVLFVIFVFGPCEALIPMLMVPAAEGFWWGVAAIAVVFGLATIVTMTAMVLAGYYGLARLSVGPLERYSHALAGLALAACGLAIQLGL